MNFKNIADNQKMSGLKKINDLGANWYLGKSEDQPLITCLKDAKTLKHNFIVAYDYFQNGMTRPTKVYGSYKNSKKFYRHTRDIPVEQRCFYVVVPQDTGCCLFADLEWDLSWKSTEQIKEKFISVVGETLKISGVTLDTEEYLFANACEESSNKGSLHAHVPCIYFRNITEQQRFYNSVYQKLNKQSDEWFFIEESDKSYILKTFIDFGVYNKNRQIRLPYSSKMKSDGLGVRPLIPDNEDDFDFQQWTITDLDECDSEAIGVSQFPSEIICGKRNVWSKELVQEVIDKLGLEVTVDTFKGNNLISLRNKKQIRICPIGGEENRSDNAYLVIRDNKLHYYCHDEGCRGQCRIIHEFKEDPRILEKKLTEECLNGSHANLARLFKHLYGNRIWVTCKQDRSFYHWNDETLLWELEPSETMVGLINNICTQPLDRLAKQILRKLENDGVVDKSEKSRLETRLKQTHKMITNLCSSPFLNNIIKFYMSFAINKDFESRIINKSTFELPILEGRIINLRTLETRPRIKSDFFSEVCPVRFLGPDADLQDVHKFMDSITCGSRDLKDYHRRLWGYMMTGEISDRSLHIFWGNGCNGKSSLVNIFKSVLNQTMVVSLSEDVMVNQKSSRGASPEMMDLLHARCGIMPESEKREKINSKRIKTITGNDDIKARHLFGHLVQFRTQCKTIWPTNHKPVIDVEDQAILDRLKLIPFLGRFKKTAENSAYIEHLTLNCRDKFFTWFCTGARDWFAGQELIPCKEMKEEMNKYIIECDVVAEFIDDMFDIVPAGDYESIGKLQKSQHRTERSIIYAMFTSWINDNNKRDDTMCKKDFYKTLTGKHTVKISKGKYYFLLKEKSFQDTLLEDEYDIENQLPPI